MNHIIWVAVGVGLCAGLRYLGKRKEDSEDLRLYDDYMAALKEDQQERPVNPALARREKYNLTRGTK